MGHYTGLNSWRITGPSIKNKKTAVIKQYHNKLNSGSCYTGCKVKRTDRHMDDMSVLFHAKIGVNSQKFKS